MSDALGLLTSARPAWARFILSPSWDLWFDVYPPPHNGMGLGVTRLRLFRKGDGVGVAERAEHRRFPAYCPERHIVLGSSFCLGLNIRVIENSQDAGHWWSDLHHFLVLQVIAEQTGRWPVTHALSHGKGAAEDEIAARRLAQRLGIQDIYDRMLEGEENWLSKRVAATNDIHEKGMRNLVRLERRRRSGVESFWRQQFARGLRCCGTMKACRLRELADEEAPQAVTA